MVEAVGVRFRPAGKIYSFDTKGLALSRGDHVIVETIRGLELGQVVREAYTLDEEKLHSALRPVLGFATEEAKEQAVRNRRDAKEAKMICKERIASHGLPMKLVDAEYTLDRARLIFSFVADGRVDFRALVRDLAHIFHTRIELRQIGVRDQAKHVGGLGCCGRVCCCKNHMAEFSPVSIRMAKDQSLSLHPMKINGVCGRLMCCLRYEQEGYEESLKRLPKRGMRVRSPEGEGVVLQNFTISAMVRLRIEEGDETRTVVVPVEVVEVLEEKNHEATE